MIPDLQAKWDEIVRINPDVPVVLSAELKRLREELMDTREHVEWAIRELDAYGHITAANTLRLRAKGSTP